MRADECAHILVNLGMPVVQGMRMTDGSLVIETLDDGTMSLWLASHVRTGDEFKLLPDMTDKATEALAEDWVVRQWQEKGYPTYRRSTGRKGGVEMFFPEYASTFRFGPKFHAPGLPQAIAKAAIEVATRPPNTRYYSG